jgi:hypothetical protein
MSKLNKMNPHAKSFFSKNCNYNNNNNNNNYNYKYNHNNLNIMEVYVNPVTKQKVIFNENVVNKPHTKLKK